MLATLGIAAALLAQTPASAPDPRLDWWREARFGLFIHWGLYAVPAGEWKGRDIYGEWIRTSAQIPLDEYDQFRERFNPTKFDADAWAKMAKDAGMKYVVITTKHHDGFSLFDSKHSEFDVMATPFRRDIMKELSTAVRANGLQMGWYHSIMDWHHPDYLPRRDWETTRSTEGADFNRFNRYLENQVTELLSNYGPIGVMWFDGQWEATWTPERGQPLYDLCRKLQPNVIVNDRVGTPGDYRTPEQYVPEKGLEVDWETCMTMNDHWGYNRANLNYKSTETLVRTLVDIASKGGNFLLNVGPTPEGEFPPESVQRLREMGAWMRVNGEAIYGTHAAQIDPPKWGRITRKGRTVFLHIFDWPKDRKLILEGVGNDVVGARLLGGRALRARRTGGGIEVRLPARKPEGPVAVVQLDLRGDLIAYSAPAFRFASDVFIEEGAVEIVPSSPEIQVRYTTDGSAVSASSPLYQQPIRLTEDAHVRAQGFHRGRAATPLIEHSFRKVLPMVGAPAPGRTGGLALSIYPGDFDKLPNFAELQPVRRGNASALELDAKNEREARVYEGFVRVSSTGIYVFELTSDDGSRLFVGRTSQGPNLVVDHDGLHGSTAKAGGVALSAGWHPIRVEWFNKTGAASLEVKAGLAGGLLNPISNQDLGV